MSVLVVVPQVLVVLAAPWIGRQAQHWGRRPLLLVGFGVLPVRTLLLTLTTDPVLVVAALIAGHFGLTTGFVAITAIALLALLVAWGLLPETRQQA